MKTRKLKSLGLDEAIKVNTLAQAKYFIEKLGFEMKPSQLVGSVIIKSEHNGSFAWAYCHNLKSSMYIFPASDFIKPKKSKLKKLEKRVEALEELIGNSEQLDKRELQVGRWYKEKENKALFFIVGNPNKEPFEVYGFDKNGDWMVQDEHGEIPIQTYNRSRIEATPEEVESALIKEAERRGFKEGVLVKALLVEHTFEFNDSPIKVKNEQGDAFALRGGGLCIYHNGKWAEILPNEKQTIDWSKAGQLVESKHSIVVITDGINTDTEFAGTCLSKNEEGIYVGEYGKDWVKRNFKPFKGELTLKNE